MNADAVVNYLVDWLRSSVIQAGAEGLILGMSGGVDSAVAGVLAKKAFPDRCMGLILPCESDIDDILHAQLLMETFSIPYKLVELDDAFLLLSKQLETYFTLDPQKEVLLKANIKPRLRMLSLYYFAQAQNYLVLGTDNKSEIAIGYTTKYGDSGVDLQVLGDLNKHQVYELARYLEIPEVIINKPPSAGLWAGQTDEKEMGITYQQLDDFLETGKGDIELVNTIQKMMLKAEHKKKMPPTPRVPLN